MNEEFLQMYVNKLANRVNELTQENLLLKSHLEFANEKNKQLQPQEETKPEAVRESLSSKIRKEQEFELGEVSGDSN